MIVVAIFALIAGGGIAGSPSCGEVRLKFGAGFRCAYPKFRPVIDAFCSDEQLGRGPEVVVKHDSRLADEAFEISLRPRVVVSASTPSNGRSQPGSGLPGDDITTGGSAIPGKPGYGRGCRSVGRLLDGLPMPAGADDRSRECQDCQPARRGGLLGFGATDALSPEP